MKSFLAIAILHSSEFGKFYVCWGSVLLLRISSLRESSVIADSLRGVLRKATGYPLLPRSVRYLSAKYSKHAVRVPSVLESSRIKLNSADKGVLLSATIYPCSMYFVHIKPQLHISSAWELFKSGFNGR